MEKTHQTSATYLREVREKLRLLTGAVQLCVQQRDLHRLRLVLGRLARILDLYLLGQLLHAHTEEPEALCDGSVLASEKPRLHGQRLSGQSFRVLVIAFLMFEGSHLVDALREVQMISVVEIPPNPESRAQVRLGLLLP